MKISLSWLKELVEYSLSPKELTDKLSLISIGVKEPTDDFLELDLTYNRGDLLSLRGVAREVAALTGFRILFSAPKAKDYYWEGRDLPKSPAEVKNQDLCPVYCIAKIEGLRVATSPDEWVSKLKNCGIRSINNVADITNLTMLEYGQPMHSFDEANVKNGTIIVRTANQGEKLITLDGKERILDETDLLITDPEKALGLAGIMGGKNSEITEKTTTIILEAAIFDPVSNRKSSKKHGLYSEATKRFQHGLTKTNLLQALSAAIRMYEQLGGKLTAISFSGNLEDEIKKVELTRQKNNLILGIDIPSEQIKDALEKLGFSLTPKDQNWEVKVPYWRLDIDIEEDLIEEVARMYGYEKITPKVLADDLPEKMDQSYPMFIYGLKKILAEAGLTEVQTYSFYASQIIEKLGINVENLIHIANPISSETEYLRDNLWPNLLEVTAKNMRQGFKDIAIFEIGKVYSPQEEKLPKETYHLSIALINGTDNPVSELSVILRRLAEGSSTSIKQLTWNIATPPTATQLQAGRNDNNTLFHPVRFVPLEKDGKQVGYIGEIHPRFVNKFGIDQRIAILEIEITVQQ